MNEANSTVDNELDRLVETAKDAVTDDMVSRLSGTAAETLDLLDRINRSGLGHAIPTLAEMANNGDLARLAGLARVYTTAEDAITDDMVGRIAETAGGGLALLDKINRSGLDKAIPVLARMAENGDLERVAQLARLVGAAEDAITDDMVGRLGETIGSAMNLADKAGQSRIAEALPVIDAMVGNGDLKRLADLARLLGAAEDAVTDDMIGRLGETIGSAAVLADKVGQSRVAEALPVIDAMVGSGDLKRLADLARLVGAAEDALNDDMVGRLAEMAGEAVSVVDRLNRSGVGRLVEVLEKLDASGGLDTLATTLPKATEQLSLIGDLTSCLERAGQEVASTPPATGGIGGLFKLLLDKENQEFIRFAMVLGRQLKSTCLKRGN